MKHNNKKITAKLKKIAGTKTNIETYLNKIINQSQDKKIFLSQKLQTELSSILCSMKANKMYNIGPLLKRGDEKSKFGLVALNFVQYYDDIFALVFKLQSMVACIDEDIKNLNTEGGENPRIKENYDQLLYDVQKVASNIEELKIREIFGEFTKELDGAMIDLDHELHECSTIAENPNIASGVSEVSKHDILQLTKEKIEACVKNLNNDLELVGSVKEKLNYYLFVHDKPLLQIDEFEELQIAKIVEYIQFQSSKTFNKTSNDCYKLINKHGEILFEYEESDGVDIKNSFIVTFANVFHKHANTLEETADCVYAIDDATKASRKLGLLLGYIKDLYGQKFKKVEALRDLNSLINSPALDSFVDDFSSYINYFIKDAEVFINNLIRKSKNVGDIKALIADDNATPLVYERQSISFLDMRVDNMPAQDIPCIAQKLHKTFAECVQALDCIDILFVDKLKDNILVEDRNVLFRCRRFCDNLQPFKTIIKQSQESKKIPEVHIKLLRAKLKTVEDSEILTNIIYSNICDTSYKIEDQDVQNMVCCVDNVLQYLKLQSSSPTEEVKIQGLLTIVSSIRHSIGLICKNTNIAHGDNTVLICCVRNILVLANELLQQKPAGKIKIDEALNGQKFFHDILNKNLRDNIDGLKNSINYNKTQRLIIARFIDLCFVKQIIEEEQALEMRKQAIDGLYDDFAFEIISCIQKKKNIKSVCNKIFPQTIIPSFGDNMLQKGKQALSSFVGKIKKTSHKEQKDEGYVGDAENDVPNCSSAGLLNQSRKHSVVSENEEGVHKEDIVLDKTSQETLVHLPQSTLDNQPQEVPESNFRTKKASFKEKGATFLFKKFSHKKQPEDVHKEDIVLDKTSQETLVHLPQSTLDNQPQEVPESNFRTSAASAKDNVLQGGKSKWTTLLNLVGKTKKTSYKEQKDEGYVGDAENDVPNFSSAGLLNQSRKHSVVSENEKGVHKEDIVLDNTSQETLVHLPQSTLDNQPQEVPENNFRTMVSSIKDNVVQKGKDAKDWFKKALYGEQPEDIHEEDIVSDNTPQAPVHTPIHTPVHNQTQAPVHTPIHTPVHNQPQAPVHTPIHTPVHNQPQAPVHTPIHTPVHNQPQAPLYIIGSKKSDNIFQHNDPKPTITLPKVQKVADPPKTQKTAAPKKEFLVMQNYNPKIQATEMPYHNKLKSIKFAILDIKNSRKKDIVDVFQDIKKVVQSPIQELKKITASKVFSFSFKIAILPIKLIFEPFKIVYEFCYLTRSYYKDSSYSFINSVKEKPDILKQNDNSKPTGLLTDINNAGKKLYDKNAEIQIY